MDYQLRYDLQTGEIKESEFQHQVESNVEIAEDQNKKET